MSIKFNNTILNYYENTNEIINIYMNQSKSKWLEIPLNQCNSEYVSPFHFKIITDDILSKTRRGIGSIQLTDDEYKEIFKYSSMEDYLKLFNEYYASKVINELRTLPQDYVFNMPIPSFDNEHHKFFYQLMNNNLLSSITHILLSS